MVPAHIFAFGKVFKEKMLGMDTGSMALLNRAQSTKSVEPLNGFVASRMFPMVKYFGGHGDIGNGVKK